MKASLITWRLFWRRSTWPLWHPSITDLVKPYLVGYFALPGGILTSLAPGGFLKTPWWILFLPGEECSPARKSHEFGIPFLFTLYEKFVTYRVLHVVCCCTKRLRAWEALLSPEVGNSLATVTEVVSKCIGSLCQINRVEHLFDR